MLDRIFNKIYLYLYPEKMICPKCKGNGYYTEHCIEVTGFSGCDSWNMDIHCVTCKGTGFVDWVSNITRRN